MIISPGNYPKVRKLRPTLLLYLFRSACGCMMAYFLSYYVETQFSDVIQMLFISCCDDASLLCHQNSDGYPEHGILEIFL